MAYDPSDNAKLPDPGLLNYCTERQHQVLSLWIQLGSSVKAAKHLDMSDRSVRKVKAAVETRAAKAGYTPTFNATRFVDPGQQIIGKSTLTKDDEGNPVWIKTKAEQENQRKALLEFVEGLQSSIEPARPKKMR